MTETTLAPLGNVTRAQMVKLISICEIGGMHFETNYCYTAGR